MKKGFTLLEVITALVILAIIAIIAVPIVTTIIDKSEISSNKRSVDSYGHAIENAIQAYELDTGKKAKSMDDLKVEYSGSKIKCNVIKIGKDQTVFLSECYVDGNKVEDKKTDDGYYHYGKYLKTIYKVGDLVEYNNVKFYVLSDSDESSDSVTLLKAEPLTVDEVNEYGAGHVNRYTSSSVETADDVNGYGGMAYYSSENCGYNNSYFTVDNCSTDYDQSEVKYVVDGWANDKLNQKDLVTDSTGYKVRLIKFEDLEKFGYQQQNDTVSIPDGVPKWIYNDKYNYWTMSQYQNYDMWIVYYDGHLNHGAEFASDKSVRPVVTVLKSSIYHK